MATRAHAQRRDHGSHVKLSEANKNKAERLKEMLATKYQRQKVETDEMQQRRAELESRMKTMNLNEGQKKKFREELGKMETISLREARKRLTTDDFLPLSIIGRGAFGEVRLVLKNDTKELWALKSMTKEAMVHKNQVGHVQAERDVLAAAENRWLVGLQFSFQDDVNLYMVMEYLPGGDLMALLMKEDTFTEEATRQYMAEMIMAVASVHSLGYIHRDLKPDNILLDWQGHLKLTDLGLSKKVEIDAGYFGAKAEDLNIHAAEAEKDTRPMPKPGHVRGATNVPRDRKLAYSTVGTPDYIAPEGYTPFYADDPVMTCRKILRWQQFFDVPDHVSRELSPECMDFMLSFVCNADSRLGKGGMSEIKDHPWFTDMNWAGLKEMKAPYKPDRADEMTSLIEEIKTLDTNDGRFDEVVGKITANFDSFEEEDANRWGGQKKVGRRDKDNDFVGYTYKRKASPNRSAGQGHLASMFDHPAKSG